jgi:heme-degrading monooxygenase HmoA
VVIAAWDSLAQIQGWLDSAKYKEDRKIGDTYATFRIFAIEGTKL